VRRAAKDRQYMAELDALITAEEAPPIPAQADAEYQTRIQAAQATAQFGQPSTRPLDGGRQPMTDAPLFGGAAQEELFPDD
jgi:hypothetical protein